MTEYRCLLTAWEPACQSFRLVGRVGADVADFKTTGTGTMFFKGPILNIVRE